MMRTLANARVSRTVTLLPLLALAACYTSPTPQAAALADPQRGAFVAVFMTDGKEYKGELLTARTNSLILLLDGKVAVAPLSAIHTVSFDGASAEVIEEGRMSTRMMDMAQSLARFPFGITPPAMAALLQHTGQDAPLELHPRTP